jgi:hypothetical protein
MPASAEVPSGRSFYVGGFTFFYGLSAIHKDAADSVLPISLLFVENGNERKRSLRPAPIAAAHAKLID